MLTFGTLLKLHSRTVEGMALPHHAFQLLMQETAVLIKRAHWKAGTLQIGVVSSNQADRQPAVWFEGFARLRCVAMASDEGQETPPEGGRPWEKPH